MTKGILLMLPPSTSRPAGSHAGMLDQAPAALLEGLDL